MLWFDITRRRTYDIVCSGPIHLPTREILDLIVTNLGLLYSFFFIHVPFSLFYVYIIHKWLIVSVWRVPNYTIYIRWISRLLHRRGPPICTLAGVFKFARTLLQLQLQMKNLLLLLCGRTIIFLRIRHNWTRRIIFLFLFILIIF